MTDEIVANQTNLTARLSTGAIAHAIATGLELSRETSENFARTGPDGAAGRPVSSRCESALPRPDRCVRAPQRAAPPIRRPRTRSTRSISARAGNCRAALRWDRFDVGYDSVAATGVRTPFSRVDDMVSWRGGAVYKPSPNGSVYGAAGTSFNPSAEGLSLSACDRRPRAGEDAQLRGRNEVGRRGRRALAHRRGLSHREDQRADAGRQSRRSADGARR